MIIYNLPKDYKMLNIGDLMSGEGLLVYSEGCWQETKGNGRLWSSNYLPMALPIKKEK